MTKILVYESILLMTVTGTLIFLTLKNKGIKELIWFLVGILALTLSRIYALFGSEAVAPLFYLITAVGYFMITVSAIKLAGYLRSAKILEHTALYDPLTGAYNRNFIEEYIKEEVRKAKRLKERFCILLVDLNDFKQVNDRYGHNAGDTVLRRVVEELRKRLREYDMIARWGGDEFLVVLPAEKETNILEVANRLVGDFAVRYEDVTITLSVGYACFPIDGSDLQRLIEIADSRMYRSKSILKEAKRYAVDDKGKEEV